MTRSMLQLTSLESRETPTATGLFSVGVGPGGPPRVAVYDSATTARLTEFEAFENTFTGGVTTAMGDLTGDGVPDLVVGASIGGGPRVRVYNGATLRTNFNPTNALIADFFKPKRGDVSLTFHKPSLSPPSNFGIFSLFR